MQKKWIKIFVVIVGFLILLNVLLMLPLFSDALWSTTSSINNSIGNVSTNVGSFFTSFFDLRDVKLNNDILLEENASLNEELALLKQRVETLQIENKQLSETYKVNESTNFNLINAKVVQRNVDSWFDTAILNKGSNDGVKLDAPVIYNGNYFGYISSVSKNTSELTYISNYNQVLNIPCVTSVTNSNGIIKKYDMETNSLVFELMEDSKDVKVGEKIYTNGYGNNTPSGIYIGTISKIEGDGALKKYYIKLPTNDFNTKYVSVVLA